MAAKKKAPAKRGKSNNSTPQNEIRQAGAAGIAANLSRQQGKSPSASTREATADRRYRAAQANYAAVIMTPADYAAMFRKAGQTVSAYVPKTKPRRGTR